MQDLFFQPTIPAAGPWLLRIGVLILLAGLASVVVYLGYRIYLYQVPIGYPLARALVPTGVLTALILSQSDSWPAVTVLMIAVLGFAYLYKAVEDYSGALFVFWMIVSGIFCGLGYPLQMLAVNLAILLGLALRLRVRMTQTRYLLLIRYDEAASPQLDTLLKSLNAVLVARRIEAKTIDLTLQVRLRDINLDIVDAISDIPGVYNALVVSREHDPKHQRK